MPLNAPFCAKRILRAESDGAIISRMSPPETVLAVDLGAKRVGAWMAGPNADDLPRQTAGALTDLDDGEQQWAQAGRRLLRGQSRRILRRNLAKRFLKIAAARALALPVQTRLARFADQLTNRRGFIRLDEGENEDEAKKQGHIRRAKVLENIADDIRQNAEIRPLLESARIPPDEFANLVGHIANLPLRVLRRYFRDAQDQWDAPLIRKLLAREIAGWKCESEDERERRRECLARIQSPDADIVRFWRETDPAQTIPPFEGNANRNPPDCPALLIRAGAAEKILGENGLRRVAEALCKKRPALAEDLPAKNPAVRAARILQRGLDWSGDANPPFRLRRQVRKRIDQNESDRAQTRAVADETDSVLGADLADRLRNFADEYYGEIRDAQGGAWDGGDPGDPENPALLARCDRNAPRKEKIQNLLLARALGCAPDEVRQIGDFRAFLKGVKVKGNRQVYSVCEAAADLQKEHGNRMKTIGERDPGGEVGKIFHEAEAAAEKLADALGAEWRREVRPDQFANPFSLAQLRNILDDAAGRAGNCKRCARENAWRAIPDAGRADGFRAAALPSDSVRPFDGILGQILNAQAERVAAEKIRFLEETGIRPAKILLVVEQNQFKFAEDLDDVKTAVQGQLADPKEAARRKARKARLQREAGREETEKPDRIISDSCGVCPYAGEALDGTGEFDHIVPRAETAASGGRGAFNSEANLIFCSARGNRQKGAKRETLRALHPEYLRKVFASADRAEVEKRIVSDIFPLLENPRDFTNFANLRRDHPDRARALRHALFVPDLRARVVREFLRTENKARVNGTQKFFARKVRESLQRRFAEKGWLRPDEKRKPRVEVVRVPSRDVSLARAALLPAEWQKPRDREQGAMSHIVDAAMAFAAARGLKPEQAQKILPDSFRVVRMIRRPPWEKGTRKQGRRAQPKSAAARFQIFGDTIFGERFLPVLVPPDGGVRVGFSLANSVALKSGGAEMLKILAPFLRETEAGALPELQRQAQAAPRGFVRLSVDKREAFARMLDAWNHGADFPAGKILNALRYTVARKRLESVGKFPDLAAKEPDQLRAAFVVRPPKLGGKFPLRAGSGEIVYPAFFAWRDLLGNPRIRGWLESSKDRDGSQLQKILREHFLGDENASGGSQTRKHHKVREKFSLPVLLSASAIKSGWRIRRRAPAGEIFQLHEAKRFVSRGFAAPDGKVNPKRPVPVLLREIARSESVAPTGKPPETDANQVAPMLAERKIAAENGRGVCALALRTNKGAMKIRIALPTSRLLKIAGLCGLGKLQWRDIPPGLKAPENPGARDEIENILAVPGEPFLAWGTKNVPFLRLAALGTDSAEVEIQTMDGSKNADLWRMFNAAAPKHP